jgi:ATP-dependent DNA ligase
LIERKQRLDELNLVGPAWITNGWYQSDGDTLFYVCSELGHEGVVAKRLDAPYVPGRRTRTWLKRKPRTGRECMPLADGLGYLPKSKTKSLQLKGAMGRIYSRRIKRKSPTCTRPKRSEYP